MTDCEDYPDFPANKLQAAVFIGSGMQKKDVAEVVGVTPQTISAWCNDPVFNAFLSLTKITIMKEARVSLRAMVPQAIECLQDLLLNSKSESIKLQVAKLLIEKAEVIIPGNGGLWIDEEV